MKHFNHLGVAGLLLGLGLSIDFDNSSFVRSQPVSDIALHAQSAFSIGQGAEIEKTQLM